MLPGGQNQLCHLGYVHTLSVPPFSAGQGDTHELLTPPEPEPEVRHSSKLHMNSLTEVQQESIIQMGTLRHQEANSFPQSHTPSEWWHLDTYPPRALIGCYKD